jgi:hypothetical protein
LIPEEFHGADFEAPLAFPVALKRLQRHFPYPSRELRVLAFGIAVHRLGNLSEEIVDLTPVPLRIVGTLKPPKSKLALRVSGRGEGVEQRRYLQRPLYARSTGPVATATAEAASD